jgi:DNA-binding NarL/FixJ family response regulator
MGLLVSSKPNPKDRDAHDSLATRPCKGAEFRRHSAPGTLRILLADDHKMMRDGLKAILEAKGFVVEGEAATGREAVALASELKPELVIMDISMPELNGIDATRRLVEELPGIKVLALSMNSDRRYVVAMFEVGAVGYLLKNSAADELIEAVRAVALGHRYVSPAIAGIVVDRLLDAEKGVRPMSDRVLSPREREVLQLLAEGKPSKEIATRLGVSVSTVETHRRQIMNKLKLHTIAELTKYALREGLTSIDV